MPLLQNFWAEISRMRGHARVDSMLPLLDQRSLTAPRKNVTINTIRGDTEFTMEIQPHLNTGLWPVYLAQADSMRPLPLPEDPEKREAPDGNIPKPVD